MLENLGAKLQAWAAAHTPNAVKIVLILVLAWLLSRLSAALIRRLEVLAEDDDPTTVSEAEKRARTLGRILRQVSLVLIWVVAAMLILGELGIDLKPILAGAGIAGLAIGFGAQTLVKDLISGFFLLLEDQVRVNDVVTIGDVTGLVEATNLRTTVLRDVDGRVHIVPNGSIVVVTNHTRGWSRAVLDIGVAYKEDTDRCLAVLKKVGADFEKDPDFGPRLTGSFEFPGVERFAESSVVLRMMVKTRPLEQWNVLRELRRRVKLAFDEAGIEIPYPHITLLVGDGSKALPVALRDRQDFRTSD